VGAGACDKAYLYVSSLKKHIQIAHPKEYDESVKTGKGKYFKFGCSTSTLNPKTQLFDKGEMDSLESSISKGGSFEVSGIPPSGHILPGFTEKDQDDIKWPMFNQIL
jgi:hypothetical protein